MMGILLTLTGMQGGNVRSATWASSSLSHKEDLSSRALILK